MIIEINILTTAIPTYKRAAYLDLCLGQMCKQFPGIKEYIEMIVSGNASTDNAAEIIHKYISSGCNIAYIKNKENIGADNNIEQAFHLAISKYVLVLDDGPGF